jgi:hypothetical protein
VLLLSAAASLMAAAFVYAMFMFFLPRQAPAILLPTPGPAAPDNGDASLPAIHGERRIPIEVGKENILDVLRTIRRPREYTAVWEITYRWAGGESTVKRQVYAGGDFVKTEWLCAEGQIARHVLTGAGRTFLWFPGEAAHHEFPGGDPDGQNGLAGYEPLTMLESGSITAAGYVVEEWGDEGWRPVLWLTVGDHELGVTAEYRIALDTELLLSAEIRDDAGNGVALQMIASSAARPGAERFRLPDGRLVWEAADVG